MRSKAKSNTRKWQHGVVTQIPRNSLILIMVAFVVVIAPHAFHVSIWIIVAALFCLAWRWMIFIGRRNFLTFWQKAGLVIASGVAVILSEGIQQNIETWAALLIISFALKLLEMKTQRDTYVIIFIAYFVIAMEFIFKKSIGIVVYELLALLLVTAAAVGMNQFHTRIKASESIKVAGKILLQAIPLMIVLFVLFPRLGPLWAIPNPSQHARTGLGAEMTPGDISKLARSDEIAFRAIFKNQPPENESLYWRGRVYSTYKNGTWSEAKIPSAFDNIQKVSWANSQKQAWFTPDNLSANSKKISYSILLEPTHDKWLLGLDLAVPVTKATGLMWDYKLRHRQDVHSLLRYNVDSYPNAVLNTWLPEFLRNQTTEIDTNDNTKTIQFAKQLFSQTSNTETFVNKILTHIQEQAYHYTLEPPLLDKKNSIDQFWFDTRQGFCTHYAGALVYMLRANNIPARMVGGYQGGEVNPLTGHVVVRQYLAHAWVEYWQQGKGWLRVDPTAAVAPSRIHDNLSAALADNDIDALSAFTNIRLNGVPGLQKMMFFFESLEHRWNVFILGYNSERQSEFLHKLLGAITTAKIIFILLIGALLSTVFVIFSLFRSSIRKPSHPVIREFINFTNKLNKKGYKRHSHETPKQFIQKVCLTNKIAENEFSPITKKLTNYLYNPDGGYTKNQLEALKSQLNALQHKITAQN